MKLIDSENNSVYIEFDDGKSPYFADAFLEKEMQLYGIEIPPKYREEFDGKQIVMLEDDDFPRAFRDVYYLYHVDRNVFRWED